MKDQREQMVCDLKQKYGIASKNILRVMLQVPRHKFVKETYRDIAYSDGPVPIGFGQTMSQPYTVAFMTELVTLAKGRSSFGRSGKLKVIGHEKIMEIGTGSGYQAAVLSHFFDEVYTVEIIPELATKARERFKKLGYKNVFVKEGSGEWGWMEKAPFDAIIVTAGIENGVPGELFSELKIGGVLVAPIGEGGDKVMTRFAKQFKNKYKTEKFGIFRFVPFVEEEKRDNGKITS